MDTAPPPPGYESYAEFVQDMCNNAPPEILGDMAAMVEGDDDPEHS